MQCVARQPKNISKSKVQGGVCVNQDWKHSEQARESVVHRIHKVFRPLHFVFFPHIFVSCRLVLKSS